MYKHKSVSDLLAGFFSGTLTSKEKVDLYHYVMDDRYKDEIILCLEEHWAAEISSDAMFAKIKSEIEMCPDVTVPQSTKRIIRIKNQNWRIFFHCAATIVIAFGLSWIIKISVNKMSGTDSVALSTQYNEIQVPNGSKTRVVLPDSSIVWLNAGSRIKYPTNFTAQRCVYLEGEAYFDVTHHVSVPFMVYASGQSITVMGTVFNVTAYQNEDKVVTTLVEGKIALKFDDEQPHQIILKPHQQAVFNKDSKSLTLATVDLKLSTSWIEGYFKFENISFEQIAKHFERTYDIVIHFENEALKTYLFTGTFQQNQDIQTVLELLREINGFNYNIQGNLITIN